MGPVAGGDRGARRKKPDEQKRQNRPCSHGHPGNGHSNLREMCPSCTLHPSEEAPQGYRVCGPHIKIRAIICL